MRRAALLAAALLAAPAAADPLQDQVLAAMRATRTDDVAFTLTTHAEQTGSPPKDLVLRYDGRGGWTLASVDGHPPTPKQQAEATKNRHQPPGYARLARWFGAPATRGPAAGTTVVYRFARLPAGAVKIGGRDISANCAAEAVVETGGARPYVSRVRFTSTAPFRMMLVARVERFQISSTYAPLADGRIFPNGNDSSFAGAMLGKSGTLASRTRFSDPHPAR